MLTLELSPWMQLILIIMFGACAHYSYKLGSYHGILRGVNSALDFLARLKVIKRYPNGSVRGLPTKLIHFIPGKTPEEYEA